MSDAGKVIEYRHMAWRGPCNAVRHGFAALASSIERSLHELERGVRNPDMGTLEVHVTKDPDHDFFVVVTRIEGSE